MPNDVDIDEYVVETLEAEVQGVIAQIIFKRPEELPLLITQLKID